MNIAFEKGIFLFLFGFIFLLPAYSQKVDSVKVEQTGNYIKITYKILNSYPDQVFRVKVKCSVNNGLMGDIRNFSGDAGERIIGGKSQYMVLWDVFKDVEDISSVEFNVSAELVDGRPSKFRTVNLTGWDKKNINIFFIYQTHGPKYGAKIGYFGNWGVAAEVVTGKMDPVREGFTISPDDLPKATYFNLDLVKRILNQNEIQGYILLGVSSTPNIFGNSQDLNDYKVIYLAGVHLGLTLAIKRVVFNIGSGGMPGFGRIEKENDLLHITSDTYVNVGLGLRF
jgi:hypothetical protein